MKLDGRHGNAFSLGLRDNDLDNRNTTTPATSYIPTLHRTRTRKDKEKDKKERKREKERKKEKKRRAIERKGVEADGGG